jgi:hypothetical protein
MTDSKFVVNGEPKTADEMTAFFEKVEREGEDKKKELTTYLKVCADGTGMRLNALTEVRARNAGKGVGGAEITQEELTELVHRLLHRIVMGETKLKNGGKKGEWNNGNMGSRWWDWEEGKVSCRVAFFSKKFSADWKFEKPYALTFDLEKKH